MDLVSLGGIAVAVIGGVVGLRRLRARETRVEIDIEEAILAKYPNRRIDLVAAEATAAVVGGESSVSWSASAEAGIVLDPPETGALDVDSAAATRIDVEELVPAGARPSRRSRRARPPVTGLPPELDEWDPSRPLPGEPHDRVLHPPMRSAPVLTARLTEEVGEGTRPVFSRRSAVPFAPPDVPPDAYEMLRRQRDHIARQVQAAYRDVHSVRTDALRRASQAEASAERAAVARERAARLVREGRRIDESGRKVSAEVPAPRDSFRQVHELRIESLKRAAEAEHGAERVSMLREKAARLLAEQRRLEAEMAKQLALRNS